MGWLSLWNTYVVVAQEKKKFNYLNFCLFSLIFSRILQDKSITILDPIIIKENWGLVKDFWLADFNYRKYKNPLKWSISTKFINMKTENQFNFLSKPTQSLMWSQRKKSFSMWLNIKKRDQYRSIAIVAFETFPN